MVVLAAFVVVVLIVEAVLVAFVFLRPGAANALRGFVASIDRAWNGTKGSPGIPERVGGAVGGVYNDWIGSMWSEPEDERQKTEFGRCVSCHPDYATKRRFESVYMNHPVHAQNRVACATCHTDTTHPNPLRVEERACVSCHTEVIEQGKCGLCHPPASLPHFSYLGAPRDGQVRCASCHDPGDLDRTRDGAKSRVHVGEFDGTDAGRCRACHEQSTCQSCHAERHPPGWSTEHGRSVAYAGEVTCYTCHTTTWCADRCHSVTPTNPIGPRPLPTGGAP